MSSSQPNEHLASQPFSIMAITQVELEEYLQNRQQAQNYKRQHRKLTEQMEAGLGVEPGPLTVQMNRVSHRIMSAKSLRLAIGQSALDELYQRVAPTLFRYLIITRAQGG